MPIEPMPEEPERDWIGMILWGIVGILGCIIFAQISVHFLRELSIFIGNLFRP